MARKAPHRSAADFLPKRLTLESLAEASGGCRGCHLYRDASQSVFGDGEARAEIMLVGETPGDKEDLAGRPFVGPAGKLLTAPGRRPASTAATCT